MSLFGGTTGVTETIMLPDVTNVDRREMLNWERELIGLYISDHPLTPYQQTFTQIVSYFSGQLHGAQHEEKVRVAGLITSVRPYTTKTNKPMGFVSIEDVQGNIDLVLFPRTWAQYLEQMTVGQIIIVEGKVEGNVTAKERVELLAPARLIGNITTPKLVITEGALFDGDCFMGVAKQNGLAVTAQTVGVDRVAAAPSAKLQADSKT